MRENKPVVTLDEGLPTASLSETNHLVFPCPGDFGRAMALGVFFLKVPDSLDLEGARSFGHQLLDENSPYRQLPQYGELEGFIALENNQQTKLALRRQHWDEHYPEDIALFGRQLDAIGIGIMGEVLRQAGIPEAMWGSASGGYTAGAGEAFLNFVHYDTRTSDWGLRPHTDYGFVTLLDASAPGLQIKGNGQFEDVPVRPGHLVVNFGEALHFITQHSDRPVSAVVHRVVSQKSTDPVRKGIVYFANPDLDGVLWQFDARGETCGSSSVEELFARLEKNLTH